MALFGQGVAEMFKDVVPQSSQGYGDNTIDWANVKPFQVIKPMSSWAATKTGATAPTPPAASTQAVTPQSEYQKWLAKQSGINDNRGGGVEPDPKGGKFGNGTNLSDEQWSAITDMRNAYGWNNPVDVNGAKAFATGLLSMAGVPGMSGISYEAAKVHERALNDFMSLREVGQNAPVGYNGDSYALGAGYGSMPAEPAATLTPEQTQEMIDSLTGAGYYTGGTTTTETPTAPTPSQTQAMVDSLTAAGYYTGSDGYNAAGDTSPTGYAADGMGPPSSAAGIDTTSSVGDFSGDVGGRDSKIICTAMNNAYGFGSYRNAVWLKYADKHLTKAHEVGYHTLFLPLVKYAFKSGEGKSNKLLRSVLEHGTRHRSADLRAEMYGRKRDNLGRFYRAVFEPLCYVVGKLKGY